MHLRCLTVILLVFVSPTSNGHILIKASLSSHRQLQSLMFPSLSEHLFPAIQPLWRRCCTIRRLERERRRIVMMRSIKLQKRLRIRLLWCQDFFCWINISISEEQKSIFGQDWQKRPPRQAGCPYGRQTGDSNERERGLDFSSEPHFRCQ